MHYCGIIISHKTYDILFSYVHIATMFFWIIKICAYTTVLSCSALIRKLIFIFILTLQSSYNDLIIAICSFTQLSK